jgi:hypothetical protein
MNQDQAEVPADYEGEPGSDFFKTKWNKINVSPNFRYYSAL